MQLSVIILNYNVRYFLALCIASVQKALEGIDAEIIVVDNASSDDSVAMMRRSFPEITLLAHTENAGFPKGNNMGVNLAKGNYICILNPDTVVAEDTFVKMLAFAQSQHHFGIAGCRLIDGSGAFLPESKRGVPTPWVAFTKVSGLYKIFPRSKWFNQYYAQHIAENETGKAAILVGAFMFMKRQMYQKVGGFDERCFMYSDDIDLSYLVLKEKKDNWYCPETTIIHFKGESTLKDGVYMKRFKEAMQFFYGKHFKKSWLFNGFMQLGMLFFALKKKTEKGTGLHRPDHFILVSDNEQLYEIARNHKNNIACYSADELLKGIEKYKGKSAEWWFDMDFFSYKEYIRFTQEYSDENFTFKIKPSNFDFFIGSNDKNDRGEVVFLSKMKN